MIPGKHYSPEELIALAWSRRWPLMLSAVAGAALLYAGSLFVPNRYQSETLVLVVPQQVPDEIVQPTNTARIEDRLNSISQQIQSRTSLERFITQYNLYPKLRAKESIDSLVSRMRDDIKVEVVRGDSFRVRYTSEDPTTAQIIATELAAAYIAENLADRDNANKTTTAFLMRQLSDAKQRLEEQEKKLEAYRVAHSGELPTQFGANQDALNAARIELRAVSESIARARDRRELLDNEIGHLTAESAAAASIPGVPAASVPEGTPILSLAQQLSAAQARLAELSNRLTTDHPDRRAAARKVRDLENDLARYNAAAPPVTSDLPTVALDPVAGTRQGRIRQLRLDIVSIDRQITTQQAQEARLRGEIAELQRRIDTTPTRETELVALTRDYETLKDIYTSLLMRSETSKLAEELDEQKIAEQFKVLDPAKVPEYPVSPNRFRLTLVGAVAGLMLAATLIGVSEYRNASLRTEDDIVTCIGLPVIAVIPVLTEERALPRGRVKRLLGAVTGSATGVIAIASAFLR